MRSAIRFFLPSQSLTQGIHDVPLTAICEGVIRVVTDQRSLGNRNMNITNFIFSIIIKDDEEINIFIMFIRRNSFSTNSELGIRN